MLAITFSYIECRALLYLRNSKEFHSEKVGAQFGHAMELSRSPAKGCAKKTLSDQPLIC